MHVKIDDRLKIIRKQQDLIRLEYLKIVRSWMKSLPGVKKVAPNCVVVSFSNLVDGRLPPSLYMGDIQVDAMINLIEKTPVDDIYHRLVEALQVKRIDRIQLHPKFIEHIRMCLDSI